MKIIQTEYHKSARKMICRKPQAVHVVPSFKSWLSHIQKSNEKWNSVLQWTNTG